MTRNVLHLSTSSRDFLLQLGGKFDCVSKCKWFYFPCAQRNEYEVDRCGVSFFATTKHTNTIKIEWERYWIHGSWTLAFAGNVLEFWSSLNLPCSRHGRSTKSQMRFRFQRCSAQNDVCSFLSDHDGWCVRVSGGDVRYDAGVHHPETLETVHPETQQGTRVRVSVKRSTNQPDRICERSREFWIRGRLDSQLHQEFLASGLRLSQQLQGCPTPGTEIRSSFSMTFTLCTDRRSGPTTVVGSLGEPILQVATGWYEVRVSCRMLHLQKSSEPRSNSLQPGCCACTSLAPTAL